MDWAFLPLQRYFVFYGRSPRAEYWWFWLLQLLLTLITGAIDFVLGLGGEGAPLSTGMIVSLGLFIPSLSVAVRRLHDFNRSGWTILTYMGLYIAAALAGGLIGAAIGGLGIGLMVLGILGVTVSFLILMASEGNPGDNSFGPNPYGLNYGMHRTACRTPPISASEAPSRAPVAEW